MGYFFKNVPMNVYALQLVDSKILAFFQSKYAPQIELDFMLCYAIRTKNQYLNTRKLYSPPSCRSLIFEYTIQKHR